MFLRFFYVKINFSLYFTYKIAISQFSWARSHYDVILTSYIIGWYLFWYQLKEDVHTYTGSKFRVIWPSVLIIQGGGLQLHFCLAYKNSHWPIIVSHTPVSLQLGEDKILIKIEFWPNTSYFLIKGHFSDCSLLFDTPGIIPNKMDASLLGHAV